MKSRIGKFKGSIVLNSARLVALLIPLVLVPGSIFAQTDSEDFGAETIEDEQSTKPLPVDLAEEQDNATAESKDQKAVATTKKTRPAETVEASEPVKHKGKHKGKVEELSNEPNDEATAMLNVKDVEISALVKSFSKLTKRNYIVDSNVKGKITMHLPTPVSISEALKILDSVLLLKGFTTVPVGENVWKVIAAKDAKQTTIPTISNGGPAETSDALITQLIRLRYVKAGDLQQVLSQFVSRDGLLATSQSTNALILIDSSANIQRLQEIASQLDVPAVDQDITIIPVQYAEAKDLADKINEILGNKDDSADSSNVRVQRSAVRQMAQGIGQPPPNMPGVQNAALNVMPADSGDKRALPIKVIPDERTNSLIVVADAQLTLKVRALAEQLDSQIDRSGGKFYVYRLKHADSEELAGVLGALISGSSGSEGTKSKDSSLSSGSSLSRSSKNTSRSSNSSFGRNRSGLGDSDLGSSRASMNSGGGSSGVTSVSSGGNKVNFEGEVSIAADTATNSLIINASRSDYLKLKEVIDELDVKRRQVLVEATILEVSMTKDQKLGVEFQGTAANDKGGVVTQTNYGSLTDLITNPGRLRDLTIAAASTGSLTLPGGLTIPSQALLINAASSNENVNVLSSPTILTTDNQEAEIIVGQNVPFVTSTSSNEQNLNNTFNQIERQDVGITLRITPQIGQGAFVGLKIFVEISNVVRGTETNENGPTTTIRTTETSVEVKSGQMIVTGGLIADNTSEVSSGVPFWEEIPVLGNFFRRDTESHERRNLLIFITPRIVTDQFEARDVTVEKRNVMETDVNRQGLEPDRQDVLHHNNIDRVTEVTQEAGVENSPITPPKKAVSTEEREAISRTEGFLRQFSKLRGKQGNTPAQTISKDELGEKVIDITVSPKLPNFDDSRPMLRSSKQSQPAPAPASRSENRYVVLRPITSSSSKRSDSTTILGLIVPRESGPDGNDFFQVGKRYSYAKGSDRPNYLCVGVYSSESDAGRAHQALAQETNWKLLSVEELIGLGKKSWLQEK